MNLSELKKDDTLIVKILNESLGIDGKITLESFKLNDNDVIYKVFLHYKGKIIIDSIKHTLDEAMQLFNRATNDNKL